MSESNAAADGDFAAYLKPTRYLDSDHPDIVAFASHAVGDAGDKVEKGVRLYYAVRDGIRYDPYAVSLTEPAFTASNCLAKGSGFCILKAALLVAAARAVAIPARLGFADVINHIATKRLSEQMDTNIFYYHGYAELYLDGKWVRSTPAFNIELCEKFGIHALDFDGVADSLFHPFDQAGRKHMEYVAYHGTYADMPFAEIRACFRRHYPRLYQDGAAPAGDFAAEAEAENS